MSKRGIEGRWHLKLRTLYRERGDLYEAKGDYDKAIGSWELGSELIIDNCDPGWLAISSINFAAVTQCDQVENVSDQIRK